MRPILRQVASAFGVAHLALATALLLAAFPQLAAAQDSTDDDLLAARDALSAQYVADLDELARWCDERSLADEAAATRAHAAPRDPLKLYLVDPPSRIGPPPPPEGASEDAARWHERFHRLRQGQAEKLFELARQAARADRTSLAVELLLAAGLEDPDHEAVRRLFGHKRSGGAWRSDYEVRQQRTHVWHETFGWLPRDHVPRYEAGERYAAGRWITAEQDARMRARIAGGWKVRTEHFTVTTDHSLEAGVRLAAKLEGLHRAWRQAFARYFASESEVKRFILGRGPLAPTANDRYEVVYFKDRDEYQRELRRSVPADLVTQGIYLPDQRTAYFYAAADSADPEDDGTLYHEATHQLFGECRGARRAARALGEEANVWLIEGIACYMESLVRAEGRFTVGGASAIRVRDARHRLLTDGFYVPLVELTALGKSELQQHEQIAMLYSQSAGLSHFLMHYDRGRYRDAAMACLEAIYDGRDTVDTLERTTGQTYATLDRQYREFMEEMMNDE